MRINDTSFVCAGFISFSTPPAFSSDTVPMRLTVLTGSKCSKTRMQSKKIISERFLQSWKQFILEKERFSQNCLLAAVALELIVAVENTIIPFAAVTEDFQLIDIPLNYASLFMRPVLFASLALSYRVWLNMRGKAIGIRKIKKKAKAD